MRCPLNEDLKDNKRSWSNTYSTVKRGRVLVVELLPDDPVAPFRPAVLRLGDEEQTPNRRSISSSVSMKTRSREFIPSILLLVACRGSAAMGPGSR